MANVKVTDVALKVQTDIPHHGEECNVSFAFGPPNGFAVFRADLAKGEAIIKAVGYADAVEYDPATSSLHIVIKADDQPSK
jgi:hypothetical protein